MDVDLLSKMIGELILDHDELSLPGLGTFVAELVPASFSDRGYTINPPYRKLSFYQRVDTDHLLIDFYARSNNISFQEASVIIVRFLEELKAVLKERKSVVLPKLGRLRATRENNFFFVPDEDLDIYPEGFALRSVSLKNHTESQAELSSAVSRLNGLLTHPDMFENQSGNGAEDNSEPVAEHVNEAGTMKVALEEPITVSEGSVAADVPCSDAALVKPEMEAEIEPEAEQLVESRQVEEPDAVRRRLHPALLIIVIVMVVIIILLGLFLLLAHCAPSFIDSILYSPTELEILNYPL